MNAMRKAVIALTALFALSWVTAAHAADNNTEFGIEDDLTVLGSGGNWNDPDAQVNGFTFIGGTIPAAQQLISGQAGNVAISSAVQIGQAGAPMSYFGSSMTVNGYGVFQSTVQMTEGNLKYGSGVQGKVLKSGGDGYVYWGTDSVGLNDASMGDPRYLQMPNAAQDALENSLLYQDTLGQGITVMTYDGVNGSSLTVTGKFEARLAARLLSTLDVTGNTEIDGTLGADGSFRIGAAGANNFTVSAADGNTAIAGTLGVTGLTSLNGGIAVDTDKFTVAGDGTGDTVVGGKLHVGTYATFVSSVTAKDAMGVAGALDVTGDAALANRLHVGTYATFVSSVTAKDAMGVAGALGVDGNVRVGAAGANNFTVSAADGNTAVAGTLAVQTNKLVVDGSGNTAVGGTLGVTGAATLESSLLVKGSAQLGDAVADIHAINAAPVAGTALKVAGDSNSGNYVATFYSGADLAAWIKKK